MKSLILADIHANLPALEAVFEQEGSWDEVIVLGDIVVAGPYPDQVLTLLAEENGVYILGNHDHEALEIDLDAPQPNAHWQWIQWTRRRLSKRDYDFLASLPDTCAIECDGMSLRLVHGRFSRELGRRLWPDSPPEQFEAIAGLYNETVILSGHIHVQFRHVCQHTTFVNPGTVGTPYMGQSLACYAVLQDGQFELKATPFDVDRICRAMDERVHLSDSEFVEGWKACAGAAANSRRAILSAIIHLCDGWGIAKPPPIIDKGSHLTRQAIEEPMKRKPTITIIGAASTTFGPKVLRDILIDAWAAGHPGETGYTFPIWGPCKRIDYLFVPPSVGVCEIGVLGVVPNREVVSPSDHCGLLVSVEIAAGS